MRFLSKAIERQKERIQYNEKGEPHCRICNKVCEENNKFIVYNRGYAEVWGPYCSKECINRVKICFICHKDFDFKEGSSFKDEFICDKCVEDIKSLKECPTCGQRSINNNCCKGE